jgi:hypothetical protein
MKEGLGGERKAQTQVLLCRLLYYIERVWWTKWLALLEAIWRFCTKNNPIHLLCDGGETHFIAWAKSDDISPKKQTYTDELQALFSPVRLRECWRANSGGNYQAEYARWLLEMVLPWCKYWNWPFVARVWGQTFKFPRGAVIMFSG